MSNLKKLTLLHSNDMHGDFLPEHVDENLLGGVSMLSGYISKVWQEEENALYCIAGDMFRGSVIDSEYQGISTIQIMNMLAPDVVTLGNHEVDYGIAHLLFLEKCADFPIVNANLYIKTNNTRLFDPCKVIEVGGMKVLFIGVLTELVLNDYRKDGLIGTFITVEEAAQEVGRICNTFNSLDEAEKEYKSKRKMIQERPIFTNISNYSYDDDDEEDDLPMVAEPKTTYGAKRTPIVGGSKPAVGGTYRPSYVPPTPAAPVQKKPVIKVDTSGVRAGTIVKHKAFGMGEVKRNRRFENCCQLPGKRQNIPVPWCI